MTRAVIEVAEGVLVMTSRRYATNTTIVADVPHFSQAIWPPTSGDLDLVVDAGGDVEQVQDLLLQVAELWLEGLDDVVVGVDELVACEVVEDLQDPWRTRCWAVA